MKIDNVENKDYLKLIEIWENSVRTTHDFLSEDDICFLKPLIFYAVDLRCAKNDLDETLGFVGVTGENIEILSYPLNLEEKALGHNVMFQGGISDLHRN